MLLKYPKGLNHTPTNWKVFDFQTTYSKPLNTVSSGFSLHELSCHTFPWWTRFFSGRGYAWTFDFPDVDKDTSLPSNDGSVATGSLETESFPPVRWLRTHALAGQHGWFGAKLWIYGSPTAVLEVPTSQRGIQNFSPDSTGVTQTKSGPTRGSNDCKGVMDCVRV